MTVLHRGSVAHTLVAIFLHLINIQISLPFHLVNFRTAANRACHVGEEPCVDAFLVKDVLTERNHFNGLSLLELAETNRAIKRLLGVSVMGKHRQRLDGGGVQTSAGG